MKNTSNNYRVETSLTPHDQQKLAALSQERKQSQAATAREAIRWYIENYERLKGDNRDSEITKAIKNLTDRICGMLARQGAQTGTLFELTWQNHVENKIEERFIAATNTVKQRMRKRLEEDERILFERMKKVVSDDGSHTQL